MGKVGSSIEINVPVDKVVAFLEDWHNAEKWYEGIYDWKPTTKMTTGNGARFAYKVKDLGMEIQYETELYDHVKNRAFKLKSVKGPKVDEQYSFEPIESGTRVSYAMDYDIPLPILGRLLDALVFKSLWSKRVQTNLQNLKELLEN
jgi:coenzyme Q-binding protein COQ10